MSKFEHFRSERVKNRSARRNSGGILLFYRKNILKGANKQPSADKHFIFLKLDPRFFKFDRDIFLCCEYIPPSSSSYCHGNNTENDLIHLLREDTEKYGLLGNIVIMGELKCRLGDKQEHLRFVDDSFDD